MNNPEVSFWSEVQTELSETGLDVTVGVPHETVWGGTIDDKPFTMIVAPRDYDGEYKRFLVLSLYGQKEEKVITAFNEFMGYSPFCKYKHKEKPRATATYEWDRNYPKGRLGQLKTDPNVFDLESLEDTLKI